MLARRLLNIALSLALARLFLPLLTR